MQYSVVNIVFLSYWNVTFETNHWSAFARRQCIVVNHLTATGVYMPILTHFKLGNIHWFCYFYTRQPIRDTKKIIIHESESSLICDKYRRKKITWQRWLLHNLKYLERYINYVNTCSKFAVKLFTTELLNYNLTNALLWYVGLKSKMFLCAMRGNIEVPFQWIHGIA